MTDLRCVAEGDWGRCDRPITRLSTGLCYGHNRQVKERGRVYRKVGVSGPVPHEGCDFPGCLRPHDSRGYCSGHYNQIRKQYPLREIRERNPEGTLCSASAEGWQCDEVANPFSSRCQYHIEQLSRTGQLKPRVQRSSVQVSERDEAGRKQCNRCATWKDESRFYHAKHTSDKRQPDCIDCYLWRNTLRNFQMTQESYESLLDSQGGGCAVCHEPPGDKRRLSVDHDHSCCPEAGKSCGKCVRGILCASCNSALGNARDSIKILRDLARYLEGWKDE